MLAAGAAGTAGTAGALVAAALGTAPGAGVELGPPTAGAFGSVFAIDCGLVEPPPPPHPQHRARVKAAMPLTRNVVVRIGVSLKRTGLARRPRGRGLSSHVAAAIFNYCCGMRLAAMPLPGVPIAVLVLLLAALTWSSTFANTLPRITGGVTLTRYAAFLALFVDRSSRLMMRFAKACFVTLSWRNGSVAMLVALPV
jgi:hypothetical protein